MFDMLVEKSGRFPIGTRIFAGFIAVLALTALTGLVGLRSIGIYQQGVHGSAKIDHLYKSLIKVDEHLREVVLDKQFEPIALESITAFLELAEQTAALEPDHADTLRDTAKGFSHRAEALIGITGEKQNSLPPLEAMEKTIADQVAKAVSFAEISAQIKETEADSHARSADRAEKQVSAAEKAMSVISLADAHIASLIKSVEGFDMVQSNGELANLKSILKDFQDATGNRYLRREKKALTAKAKELEQVVINLAAKKDMIERALTEGDESAKAQAEALGALAQTGTALAIQTRPAGNGDLAGILSDGNAEAFFAEEQTAIRFQLLQESLLQRGREEEVEAFKELRMDIITSAEKLENEPLVRQDVEALEAFRSALNSFGEVSKRFLASLSLREASINELRRAGDQSYEATQSIYDAVQTIAIEKSEVIETSLKAMRETKKSYDHERKIVDEVRRYTEINSNAASLIQKIQFRTPPVDGHWKPVLDDLFLELDKVIRKTAYMWTNRPGAGSDDQLAPALNLPADSLRAHIEEMQAFALLSEHQAVELSELSKAQEKLSVVLSELLAGKQTLMGGTAIYGRNLIILATLGAILTGLLFAFLTTLSVTLPLKKTITVLEQLRHGNSDVQVPGMTRRDELGTLALATDTLRLRGQKVKDLKTKLQKEVVGEVAEMTKEALSLDEQSKSAITSMQQAEAKTSDLLSTVDRARTNLETIAKVAQNLEESSKNVTSEIGDTSDISTNAMQQLNETRDRVERLITTANKVENAAGLIKDIAEQTNLLALNATIEAARAGDAGRGFAVVATEVKALAGQASNATMSINEEISAMTLNTGSTRQAVDDLTTMMQEIDRSSSIVADASRQQTDATDGIGSNLTQLLKGVENVKAYTDNLLTQITSTKQKAQNVEKGINRVRDQTRSLNHSVESFLKASAGE